LAQETAAIQKQLTDEQTKHAQDITDLQAKIEAAAKQHAQELAQQKETDEAHAKDLEAKIAQAKADGDQNLKQAQTLAQKDKEELLRKYYGVPAALDVVVENAFTPLETSFYLRSFLGTAEKKKGEKVIYDKQLEHVHVVATIDEDNVLMLKVMNKQEMLQSVHQYQMKKDEFKDSQPAKSLFFRGKQVVSINYATNGVIQEEEGKVTYEIANFDAAKVYQQDALAQLSAFFDLCDRGPEAIASPQK